MNAQRVKAIERVLEWQADRIELVMAGFGLPGRVIGGDVVGTMERPTHALHTWQLGAELTTAGRLTGPRRLGTVNPDSLAAVLAGALDGATVQADGDRLIVRVALDVAELPKLPDLDGGQLVPALMLAGQGVTG